MKIYCEHGALSKALRSSARDHGVDLVHFPYDPDARSNYLNRSAVPSEAQWRDVHMAWKELGCAWADFSGSEHLAAILQIIGLSNRRDALHVDSAYKSGCAAFITADTDILNKRMELEDLLGIPFYHPDQYAAAIARVLNSNSPHNEQG